MIKLLFVLCFIAPACHYSEMQTGIELLGLKNEYNEKSNINCTIKNNLKERVYFHLEGEFFSKESQWMEFNNNLMSPDYSKTEKNYWIGPDSTFRIEIPAERFTRQFRTKQDSFRIEVVYYDERQGLKKSMTSNSFSIMQALSEMGE